MLFQKSHSLLLAVSCVLICTACPPTEVGNDAGSEVTTDDAGTTNPGEDAGNTNPAEDAGTIEALTAHNLCVLLQRGTYRMLTLGTASFDRCSATDPIDYRVDPEIEAARSQFCQPGQEGFDVYEQAIVSPYISLTSTILILVTRQEQLGEMQG
ncbi:MAG: hypothetical protein GY822_06780 [Deltaproteobacteria bacterium]|nr:hypothetical protein [Deltaproteobacteria bacterium]